MHNQLKRSLTWVQGTALAIGAVVGSGILVLPAVTAQQAGPASLISWVIMSLITLPICLTLGRLATNIPNAGGIVAYARTAFGPMAGTLTGWVLLGSIPIGLPIVSLIGANYVGSILHLSNWAITGIAAIMLATSLILNFRGIKVAGWISVLTVCIIILLLILAVVGAAPYVEIGAFDPFVPNGWLSVGMAAVVIFFAFVGWEMFAHLAEEFKNPVRDIPISLILSALIISLLYLAIAFVTVGAKAYGTNEGLAPLSILVKKGFGSIAGLFTAILALLISFGAIQTNIAGFSRMIYAQAREGDFPAIFTKLHPTYKTPIVSIYSLAAVFAFVLMYNGFFKPNLEVLLKWPSVIFIVSYIIAMASALKLLSKRDIGWWMALIAFVVCVIIYLFSGWAFYYPFFLAIIGYIVSRKKL